ncbi:CPBP family intramembrane metalloprotease [Salinadaptatus halalkaliphilus]|uniref:CPBP family intramembrane metalloprotease n=1 Tax=Salinadaptatus halalkaliphilus TaxID=2419781 RepID=A0A4S3TNF5_9EURY|nr:CPBP family intramembrane glutamic endopeptidase [Salinadaptatus halalkaliphilus]THE65791.1 CPBP family intramembrane metalloprotease [Salinadaptatus halalkaliphilus]
MSETAHRNESAIWATLVAVGLAAFGIAATQVTTLPAFLLDPALIDAPAEASMAARTLMMVLNFVGFALAGAIYLAWTGRGWAYVDLRWPTTRGWLYVVGGIVVSILFYVVASILLQFLELPATENQIVEIIGDDQTMILLMIVIVFFFNAPAEEFLFRNVVQKRLYDAVTKYQAVVIASLIFALVHLPVYFLADAPLLAVAVSLGIVFGGSVIFGWLYAETDNLVVPIAAHAAFNAFQFGLLYLAFEYDIQEPAPSMVVDLFALVGL